MTSPILLLATLAGLEEPPAVEGTLEGVVVNASRDGRPVVGADVVLRVLVDGQFISVAKTASDAQGGFCFRDLPLDEELVYLPGANRDGVHYPGPRLRLSRQRPHAQTKLEIREALAAPDPLVVRSHDILVAPESGVLRVTETMIVENPTTQCYVGEAEREGHPAVTLTLAIPSDFEQITFDTEFFGRRFSLIDGKLVTSVPWQPGRRELGFSYTLRNDQARRTWTRPLDLPSSRVRLRVRTDKPEQVSCNLQRLTEDAGQGPLFGSGEEILPAGHVVRLELGHLPVPWIAYGRWVALAALIGLVAVASIVASGRRKQSSEPASQATKVSRKRRRRRETVGA